MRSAAELARPEILALTPYASARNQVPAGDDCVRLDANESPVAPFPGHAGLNRYPSPQPQRLLEVLSRLYAVPVDHLLVGRGSDEAVDLLVRVFCRPGVDAVLTCPPTFGFYRVAAEIQGARVVEVPLSPELTLDADGVVDACRQDGASVKLAFLCTPNNPTGGATEPSSVIELARRLPDQLLVVDEAYIEFSSTASVAGAVDDVPNLVVLRTLSKAYGLAGARCGAAIAQPEVIELLRRVQAPYPIPAPTESAVLEALTPHGVALVERRVEQTRRSRDELALALGTAAGVRKVYPSEANFLLLEVEDRDALAAGLRARGILVRQFGERLPGHIRVSIGTDDENALFLEALGIRSELGRAHRTSTVTRRTKETNIAVTVDLDDGSVVEVATGIGFYDHMLEQVAKHGGFGLRLTCEGDLHIDDHHTVEDCALALGRALRESLGDKRGIERYGFVLPMDEARAEALVDLSGRPKSVFEATFPDQRVGGLATEMVPHVFESLSQELGAAIHVRVEGRNTHHMVEGAFKAFGRALRQAIRRTGDEVPSTKGVL